MLDWIKLGDSRTGELQLKDKVGSFRAVAHDNSHYWFVWDETGKIVAQGTWEFETDAKNQMTAAIVKLWLGFREPLKKLPRR